MRDFQIGGTLGTAFQLLFGNFGSFVLIGMLAFLPLALWMAAVASPEHTEILGVFGAGWAGIGSSIFATMLFTYIAYGAIVHGAIQSHAGHDAGPGAMLGGAVNTLPAVLAASLMSAVIIIIGYALLLIPGIIFSVMLFVTIPTIIEEGQGPVAALRRSIELTDSYRWPIFWTSVVGGLVTGVLSMVMSLIGNAIVTGGSSPFIEAGLFLIESGLSTAFSGALVAAVYLELREIREGIPDDRIAETFA